MRIHTAERKIGEAWDLQSSELDLSEWASAEYGLRELPPSLRRLTQLKKLNLGGNRLTDVFAIGEQAADRIWLTEFILSEMRVLHDKLPVRTFIESDGVWAELEVLRAEALRPVGRVKKPTVSIEDVALKLDPISAWQQFVSRPAA